ncbi:homoserine kinase (plasmid) [Paracoccus liaowanqingii]|uniref:Homoserine kinase n=1 Tax=Paracoccus liaowanqingii TaxID=2560053 RepID=A0A4Y5SQU1_9RHOB|nr:phosphotransferase [Paracoccus liaowanqingii]QDA35851.1 homoserine kinase [Paracoccus liaowanqingii]
MNDAEALMQAQQAAAAWGATDMPRLIRNRENAVFSITTPQGRGALRLHRPGYQSDAAIRSELWWCEALARVGASVPKALRTRDGTLLHHLPDGRRASLIGWVEGDLMGEGGVPLSGDRAAHADLHRRLGALLAQVHRATDALSLPGDFSRPRWDIPGLLGEAPLWGRFWDHPQLSADESRRMSNIRAACRDRLQDYAATGPDTGLIHADVLRENVLLGDHMTLIDFDDSGFGFRLYDLGTVLSQTLSEPHSDAIRNGLVSGYGTLGPADLDMLAVFTLLRTLASVGWTMGRVPPGDPRHRAYIDRAFLAAERAL